jgi:GxxExxY protein
MIITKKYVNELAYEVVGAAIDVHKNLGPGLLESVYEKCLIHELNLNGLKTNNQVKVPINYKGITLDADLRTDIIVENLIVVELKAADLILPIYKAQLLTYLKLMKMPKGLLINFNTFNITESLVPLVNNYFESLPDE